MGKVQVVHYIFRDVFAAGYISFMLNSMDEYEHVFVMKNKAKVFRSGIQSNKADTIKVDKKAYMIFIDNDSEVYENELVNRLVHEADWLVISGLFFDLTYFLKYGDDIWQKTYLHFWGGDFYCFRNSDMRDASPKKYRAKELLLEAVNRCYAILTVLDTDYEKISSILQIDKLHFEAPMPEDNKADLHVISEIIKKNYLKKNNSSLKIIIGNSASSANCHLEIFDQISWLVNEDVELYCPLSYGEVEYRDKVIENGKKVFGNKIHFLTEFMPLQEYVAFLNTCDIGIYNNNRQQGFKNITMMLCLGQKIFVRNNTAMKSKLDKLGIAVNGINEIVPGNMNVFRALDESVQSENRKRLEAFVNSYKGAWEYIFNIKSQRGFLKRGKCPITLSIHLTDHCNLNCKGCSHFAPVAPKNFITIEELERTVLLIKQSGEELYDGLCLMGGEPLLHPKLGELILICRKYLKKVPIKLVTNGICIMDVKEDIWKICCDNQIDVEITIYPISIDYEKRMDYLKHLGVNATVYVNRKDGEFRKDTLEIGGDNDIAWNYSKCRIGGLYPQIRDGKLYRCATAANSSILNEVFDTHFEQCDTDYLQLQDIHSASDLRYFLQTPSSFCRYCNIRKQRKLDWGISKKTIEEWM